MTIAMFKLTTHEARVLAFWKANVSAESAAYLEMLIEQHDEHAVEAGPHGGFCEYTREMLAPIVAEINERLETILERYADWASD
jgi:hypothetical protein